MNAILINVFASVNCVKQRTKDMMNLVEIRQSSCITMRDRQLFDSKNDLERKRLSARRRQECI